MNGYPLVIELSKPIHCQYVLNCPYMTLQALEYPFSYVPICAYHLEIEQRMGP